MASQTPPTTIQRQIDPFAIFCDATSFIESSHLVVSKTTEHLTAYLLPGIILRAFGLELYLKCLHCIDTRDAPTGHPIEKLFNSLSQARRDRITQHFYRTFWGGVMLAAVPFGVDLEVEGLPAVLKRCNLLFVEGRYRYQRDSFPNYNGLDDLLLATRTVVAEQHPDWYARFKAFG